MSGSGQSKMVINTRERAVSLDIMRLQAFHNREMAEFSRYLFDAQMQDDEAAGIAVVGSATSAPLRAVILNGLLPRPQIGGTDLFIDPGLVFMVNPDATPDPDDVPMKWINDAGVTVGGTLTLTANASGSSRIDIIECSRNPDQTVESDNRDIYDVPTGLFSAVSVPKVKKDSLTYRIRQGTPGGGFAGVGVASGWLPLAVVRVPNGATTWDNCDLWDVRPLAADIDRAPFNINETQGRFERQWAAARGPATGAGNRFVTGVVKATHAGRVLGGNLFPTGGVQIDLNAAAFQEPGFAVTNSRPWYLYLVTPHGLPRWAKYSPASAGVRKPLSPRGIPIFTQKGPTTLGKPGSAISLPSGTDLGGSTTEGAVILSGAYGSGGFFSGGHAESGETVYRNDLGDIQFGILPAGVLAAPTTTFTLADNTHMPANASAIYCMFELVLTGVADSAANFSVSVQAVDQDGTNAFFTQELKWTSRFNGVGSFITRFYMWVPLWPNLGAATNRIIKTTSAGGTQAAATTLQICGWRMGH